MELTSLYKLSYKKNNWIKERNMMKSKAMQKHEMKKRKKNEICSVQGTVKELPFCSLRLGKIIYKFIVTEIVPLWHSFLCREVIRQDQWSEEIDEAHQGCTSIENEALPNQHARPVNILSAEKCTLIGRSTADKVNKMTTELQTRSPGLFKVKCFEEMQSALDFACPANSKMDLEATSIQKIEDIILNGKQTDNSNCKKEKPDNGRKENEHDEIISR
ncbi:hypothetical protein M514_04513 [Trichuris suis]|uniref:Uncharacterized protein n=1 Tax=Trichuris suis TaxID=68888 RepID=A0A085N607_9BILA|nr:hypothetical protein M514_04513 [Trichuris suis]